MIKGLLTYNIQRFFTTIIYKKYTITPVKTLRVCINLSCTQNLIKFSLPFTLHLSRVWKNVT